VKDVGAIAVERRETIGYARLLRENPQFRRLWLGQVVSNAGDWFNNIAVLGLVLQLTNSPAAAGWVIIVQQLPSFFLSPVSGAIVDRFDRRRVMIAADLIRAAIAMGFLLIRGPIRSGSPTCWGGIDDDFVLFWAGPERGHSQPG
jgi:Bacterial protein of unknown function (DUF894).